MPNKRPTQKEISEMTGLSEKSVWLALKNPQNVKKSTLEKVEQALGGNLSATRVFLKTPVENWADELSKLCSKYSGEDWGFEFKAAEECFEFKGFINIQTEITGSRGKHSEEQVNADDI
jgi:transcriptional regulator with XRE-family HTH domain